MMDDKVVRDHVLALLRGGQAFMTFDDAVADFPADKMNAYPPNADYTPWHLLEHLRRTQWDILDYCRNPNYKEQQWPTDYWPAKDAKTDAAGWNETLAGFRRDLQAMKDLVADPKTDLLAAIPHGYGGHTILREALLVADHNAYHTGEFAVLRQVMGTWPKGHK